MYLDTRLEGQDIQRFQKGSSDAKQFTLQFWIKLAVTGTYVVQLFDADNSRHVVANYTVSSANTWEKKIITFPADTSGTFDNDNARSLDIRWHFLGGSTYRGGTQQTTWGSIVPANMLEGMGNAVSATGDNFITGMQLEVGPQATSFEHNKFGEDLALCQRYFQVLGGSNGTYDTMSTGACASTTIAYVPHRLVTSMRATPSFTLLGSASDFMYTRDGGDHTPSAIVYDQAGKNMIAVKMTGTSLNQDDATRLFNMNTNSGYLMDAEL